MKTSHPSPLVRGKPRFIARFMRWFLLYMLGNVLLLMSMFVVLPVLSDFWVTLYSLGMLVYVFGCQVLLARWLRGHGVSYLRYNSMLVDLDRVPCPNCLYPLCSPKKAHEEHVCAECGCAIRGEEAIRAWGRVRGMRVPRWWLKVIRED